MRYNNLIFEKKDFVMILRHRESTQQIEDYSHQDALHRLEENMAKAIVHNLENMPDDVIRLYSWVTVSSASGWQKTFQVMLPYEQDITRDRISAHSDLGATVIGRAEGDIVKFGIPIGIIPLKIEKVEQSTSYIKEHLSVATYKKYLSKRQRASLLNTK
jgi:regulator of nucleoside diphosphate kinase